MKAKGIPITIRGTLGSQFVPGLQLLPTETFIVKKRYSAFFGTNLDSILADLNPDPIIIAGINTHACIRMTAIDAYQRDWNVVLASECIGSYDKEHEALTLRYLQGKIAKLMTLDEMRAVLPPFQA